MAFAIVASVGNISDDIEHGAACASQDDHEGNKLPKSPVLDDGADVWPERHDGCAYASHGHEREHYSEPVRGPVNFGDGAAWQMASDPVSDRLRGGRTIVSVSTRTSIPRGKSTHPEVKSNRTGSVLATANSPVEGWKSKRTGAVCRPSW